MLRQIVDLAFFDADEYRIAYRTDKRRIDRLPIFALSRPRNLRRFYSSCAPLSHLLSAPTLTPFSFTMILTRRASEIHLNNFRFTSSFRFLCRIFTDLGFFAQPRPRNRRFHFSSLCAVTRFLQFLQCIIAFLSFQKKKLTKYVASL